MDNATAYFVSAILIGIGATAVTDAWAFARTMLTRAAPPDYGLVGRWIAYMPRGRFHHDAIAKSERMPYERVIGWTAHYVIGIGFASILLAIFGLDWARQPTIGPALLIGIATVLAPFLIMQPGMGAGIAASRAPNPNAARVRSIVTHAVFGVGLYLAALAARWIE